MPADLPTRVKDRQAALRRALLAWFRHGARDLPWRRTRNPYRIWLSEIMLQQTRVQTVLAYYARFLKAFPSVRQLARAREDRVLKLWEGLGYYARARNLHKAARQLVREHAGRMPRTAAEWRNLPGVGRYTAGAIASIAFGERVPVLDGNVKRVLARIFQVATPLEDAATLGALWDAAGRLVPARSPGEFNQALMELGARLCTPRTPRCDACPVRRWCEARAAGRQEALPVRRPRRAVPHREVVAAAILRKGRYLLGKRPPGGMLAGLWEFPGGKVEPGESHRQALAREIAEELRVRVKVGRRIAAVDHAYTHLTVTIHLYACQLAGGQPQAHYHSRLQWVRRAHFGRYALPAANRKLLESL